MIYYEILVTDTLSSINCSALGIFAGLDQGITVDSVMRLSFH